MMDVWPVLVELLEFRDPMPKPSVEVQAASPALHLPIKGKFGAGKQANGHIGFIDRGKTTGDRVGETR